MLSILNSIIDSIVAIFSFITHSITSIVNLVAHVPQYVAFLTASINVLPGVIIPFAIVSISLGAVLFILGR